MEKPKKHNCKKNCIFDGEQLFDGNSLFIYGNCKICDKKIVETWEYIDTRNVNTDEVILD